MSQSARRLWEAKQQKSLQLFVCSDPSQLIPWHLICEQLWWIFERRVFHSSSWYKLAGRCKKHGTYTSLPEICALASICCMSAWTIDWLYQHHLPKQKTNRVLSFCEWNNSAEVLLCYTCNSYYVVLRVWNPAGRVPFCTNHFVAVKPRGYKVCSAIVVELGINSVVELLNIDIKCMIDAK